MTCCTELRKRPGRPRRERERACASLYVQTRGAFANRTGLRSLSVIVSSSHCLVSRASARKGDDGTMRRDNETITLGDNCLCLRLASRVCTDGAGAAGRHRHRHRQSRSVTGCVVHGLVHGVRATPYTCRRAGGSVHVHFALVTVSESSKVPPIGADARDWNFGTSRRSPCSACVRSSLRPPSALYTCRREGEGRRDERGDETRDNLLR